MIEVLPTGFSIVLCTYNGVSRLEPTLEYLANLKIPTENAVELILVNNASTDKTEVFAKEVWVKLGDIFPLIIINENRPGKGYAIETGYDAAKYSYILTVDDDNWLSHDYLVTSLELIKNDPNIGVLLGKSTGVFEKDPPLWFNNLKEFFIIGSPIKESGYLPENDYYVWGAGMIIFNRDWKQLRKFGFSSLTSKFPGKAAGEDNETAIGLLMLGRRIYYSDKLNYKHFMPESRMNWDKLKQNFDTLGYVSFYTFLYALVMDAYENNYSLTKEIVKQKFKKYWLNRMKCFTWKHHLAFWIKPLKEHYQLRLILHYSEYKWFLRLSNKMMHDILFLQKWMLPVLEQCPGNFTWPNKDYWSLK